MWLILALVCDVYCNFVTFSFGILGQAWYLIVSITDPCYLSYFDTHLTHRRKQVSLINCKSDFERVTYGVPQGFILGPLLILLCINDSPLYMNYISTDLYADNSTFYDIQISLEAVEMNLQDEINHVHIWSINNGMESTSVKSEVMLVITNQNRLQLQNIDLNYQYLDETLKVISSDKILLSHTDNN